MIAHEFAESTISILFSEIDDQSLIPTIFIFDLENLLSNAQS
jgi:hypothetical protein